MWLYTALLLFSLTTILGLYLSSLVLRNKVTAKGVIVIHGFFSLAGFSILFFFWPASEKSILFFTTATLSGLVLLYQDLTDTKFSKWLCYVHAGLTLIGLFFLTGLAFGI